MRIALVHDYIKEYGGAERVLEVLHEAFPDAPIYTTVFLPEFLGPHKKRFEDMNIKTSILQKIPLKEKLISPFRLLSPFVFSHLDLSKYDVVIVSQTGAYFPNLVKKGPYTNLYTYTHTPPRYLYGYATAREWKNNLILLILGEIINHFLRIVDFNASKNVDQFLCNSEEVKGRIRKFYRRDATVIYPPIETINSKSHVLNKLQNSQYYLAGGRLARAKGIDVIVEAFKKNKKNLKIFGKGFAGYEDELRSKAGGVKNIEFVGEVSDEKKLYLMSKAKAYIFASYDEDFGITPVEAMSVGTPVIAYQSGGVQETVVDGKTGLFYKNNKAPELNSAINMFEKMEFDKELIKKHAGTYSKEHFISKITKLITNA